MRTQVNEFMKIRRWEEEGMSSKDGDEVSVSGTRIGMMSDLKYKFRHV